MPKNEEALQGYPRMLKRGVKFNPLEVARQTESIVCKDGARKYTAFYATGVYGGIATGYVVGCCLRCYFCWTDLSRDFPEVYGKFYSAEEVCENIVKVARKWRVNKARISGGEPTLCRKHLTRLLELIQDREEVKLFILETNGILFGAYESYVKDIAGLSKVYVRVSLKAGEPEAFESRTGASKDFFELPFKAIKNLLENNVRFHVAAMTDPRIMPPEERRKLLERLAEIDQFVAANLEEEVCDPYEGTLARMHFYGIDPIKFFGGRY
ncbi:MAG: radical SAM protein [Candidatus Nezhaarchaeota archaeon]|nr:radical SAM protein [Candidatus Nezhaarchaeota archaeon]MCX8141299.1 radical SAM protein [Candidatus Nezhaarchaeota archaeon]MDW8049565.1 radical SAM protein [Nitrososphaerota archaeon]